MKCLFTLLLLFIFGKAFSHTLVIGTGSGVVIKNDMKGLHPGDSLAIRILEPVSVPAPESLNPDRLLFQKVFLWGTGSPVYSDNYFQGKRPFTKKQRRLRFQCLPFQPILSS